MRKLSALLLFIIVELASCENLEKSATKVILRKQMRYTIEKDQVELNWDLPMDVTGPLEYRFILFRDRVIDSFVNTTFDKFRIKLLDCSVIGITVLTVSELDEPFFAQAVIDPTDIELGPPTDISVTNDDKISGQIVQWNPPMTPTICELVYKVEMKRMDDINWTTIEVGPETRYEAKLLEWDTVYEYKVSSGLGPSRRYGMSSNAVTLNRATIAPDRFTTFEADATINSIMIRWYNPETELEKLTFNLFLNSLDYSMTKTLQARIQTWKYITNLNSCTVYSVALSFYNVVPAVYPLLKMVKTKPHHIPSVPRIVETNSECGKIYVKWSSPSEADHVNSYRVDLRHGDDGPVQLYPSHQPYYWFDNLKCDEAYYVTVRSINPCGYSLPSDTVQVIAMKRQAPNAPQVSEIRTTENSLHVKWSGTQPSKAGLRFRVIVYDLNDTSDRLTPVFDQETSNYSATVERLQSCTAYNVSLSAINAFGASEFSWKHTYTKAPVINDLPTLDGHHESATSHALNWTFKPVCFGRCNVSYQIRAQCMNTTWIGVWDTTDTSFKIAGLNSSHTYRYDVRVVLGTPNNYGNFSEPIYLQTYTVLPNTLLSPWSHGIIAGIAVSIAFLLLLIFILARKNSGHPDIHEFHTMR